MNATEAPAERDSSCQLSALTSDCREQLSKLQINFKDESAVVRSSGCPAERYRPQQLRSRRRI